MTFFLHFFNAMIGVKSYSTSKLMFNLILFDESVTFM